MSEDRVTWRPGEKHYFDGAGKHLCCGNERPETGILWIVFADKEPTTSHMTEDAAKEAARRELAQDASGRAYSIWTARLTHSMDQGIPILRMKEGLG